MRAAMVAMLLAACSSSGGTVCATGSDCATGEDCLFPATDSSDCSAKGECISHDSLPPATDCGTADFRCTCTGDQADLVCGPGDVFFSTSPTTTLCPG